MNLITRWHLLERFWEPIRRWVFRAKQLNIEREYWKADAQRYAQNASYWRERAETAERELV